jgi:hypothetical protein
MERLLLKMAAIGAPKSKNELKGSTQSLGLAVFLGRSPSFRRRLAWDVHLVESPAARSAFGLCGHCFWAIDSEQCSG